MSNEIDRNDPSRAAQRQKIRFWTKFINNSRRKFDERRSNYKKESPTERAERRTANATWFIGVFTVVTACVGGLQWCAIHGQLREMKAQRAVTIIQLRGDLRREPPLMEVFGNNGKIIGAGENILGWYVTPQWINAGSTDVVDYQGWFKLFPRNHIPNRPIQTADCPRLPKPSKFPLGMTLEPNRQMAQLAQPLHVQDVVDAANGKNIIFLVGHVEYRDVFSTKRLHQKDWCILLIPNDIPRNLWSEPTVFETGN